MTDSNPTPANSENAGTPERPESLPEDPRPIVLEARGITRHYELADKRLEVLRGIDIVVREGEMVSVMGMSGVGKSTLLNILGLLDTASSGQVIYHLEQGPVEGSGLKEDERAALRNEQIGFVFQFYHLLPDVNVLDNVLLPSMIRRSGARFRREKKQLTERAADLLARVGLSGREKQMPGTRKEATTLMSSLSVTSQISVMPPTTSPGVESGRSPRRPSRSRPSKTKAISRPL